MPVLQDNTLYSESDTLSNGAGQRMFAGNSGGGAQRRALIKFDVAIFEPTTQQSLQSFNPATVTVDSVVLRLNLAQTQIGSRVVNVHRVLADWGEGTSVPGGGGGGEGGGAGATANDATWGLRFFGAALPWTTPGGDYVATPSASKSVGGLGFYEWRSPQLTADVIFWLANSSQNFGWELIGVETGFATAKAFNTRNATDAATRPVLTVYATVTPAGLLPGTTRLYPVQPNPFNPTATIRYQIASDARVRLDVYDAQGRRVRTLIDGVVPAGPHDVVWHGDDSRRERVASGVYFARLRVGNEAPRVEKMVLVK
jgi:hypothetical protein